MTVLDKHGAVPLYLQLKRLLENRISTGTLPPHSRVSSERELSEQYGISRMTARQALAELIQEGRLYTSAGKGTFVAEPKIQQNVQSLTSFTEEMRSRGLSPETQLLRREVVPATPTMAHSLRITEGTPIVCIERLRLADHEPLAIETACLYFDDAHRLLELGVGESLYAVLRREFGIIPVEAVQEFEATLAQPR
jgi:GntR family transcriptional regulator